jgi:hypothetical protein
MEAGSSKLVCFLFAVCACFQWATCTGAQEVPASVEIPDKFHLDMETAARLRPQLLAASTVVPERYATGRLVFERLVSEVHSAKGAKLSWELRIVDDDGLNAYSSPDGTIYVESGLAQLAGPSAGLWAAILSHEMAHIVRRDWARRYLYERSLQRSGGAEVVLGDPGLAGDAWIDSRKASEDLARFCRRIEVEADRASLMLMARAGFHPDFVPALHHLLHAQGASASGKQARSVYAMHPCWEERDRELEEAYLAASIEFEHLWPEWYASPGGNPPIVVFAEEPTVRKAGPAEWEIRVPMRCQNLAGAVEVVLRKQAKHGDAGTQVDRVPTPSGEDGEIRQLTGCTSPKTTITFTLSGTVRAQGEPWTDVYVLDAWGSVLARAEIPRLHR